MARGTLLGTVLCLVLAASCAGRSIEGTEDDDATGGTRNQGGTQGTPASPGTGGSSGSAPVGVASGGASTGVGGSNGATGSGAAPSAGRASGSGATPGRGGEGGHGGKVTCTDEFTHTAYGKRCSDGDAYAQGPTFELVVGATELDQCLDACRARPDCRAVSAYFEGASPPICSITHEGCDEPFKPDWSEESGGRSQRKACDSEGCSYEPLGLFRCSENEESVSGATSLDDCIEPCDADETCTSVIDYFYLEDVFGHCFMSVGTCGDVVTNAEEGTFYRRNCE